MFSWHDLKGKPRAARERYAFFGATIITGVIGVFWLVALSVEFQGTEVIIPEEIETDGAFARFWGDARETTESLENPFELEEVTQAAQAIAALNTATSATTTGVSASTTITTRSARIETYRALLASSSASTTAR